MREELLYAPLQTPARKEGANPSVIQWFAQTFVAKVRRWSRGDGFVVAGKFWRQTVGAKGIA